MKKNIDCLIIGHNEMSLEEYESIMKTSGTNSESYRELNLSFIEYEKKKYSAKDIFNYLMPKDELKSKGPLSFGNLFSATIAYLMTFLVKKGFECDYINYFNMEKEELAHKLQNDEIMTVAITTTMYVTPFPIMEIISFIRQYNKSAKIIVGGPFVHANTTTQEVNMLQYILKSIDADIYISNSQGETAFVNVLSALKENKSLEGIKNVIYKGDTDYNINSYEAEDNDINENLINWPMFSDRIKAFATIRTSISCPFSCAFCTFPQRAGKYRPMQLEAYEKEMDSLKKTGNVKKINFIDDTFNVPPERFKSILRMMIKNNYGFKWNSFLRCQYIDRETVELMKESGCEGVFLGIESGSQKILQNMNKAANIEKYKEGLALLNEYGIISFASFIIGFPGETYDTYMETVKFIEEHKPTFYRVQAWYFDSLSPVFKDKEKYKLTGARMKWSHSTMDSMEVSKLVEQTFSSVKNSIWIPQFNFDYLSIYLLLERGMDLDSIKKFLTSFNSVVARKLINPECNEADEKDICSISQIFNSKG